MEANKIKKVVFMTGTRAEFGKIKSLMTILLNSSFFDVHIFATGMHMNSKYGYTVDEIEKCKFPNIYKYINHSDRDPLDSILANTISGFGNYVREIKPDLIFVHGDRVESLAGALVGSLNNILVAHIEGGEISGTIDDLIRHAISKISHIHFVANAQAKKRLIQMGEDKKNIFVTGSPDLDIINSKTLPSLKEAKRKYDIPFDNFAMMLFHPVTTDLDNLPDQTNTFIDALLESQANYIGVYPNNDPGTEIIFSAYSKKMFGNSRFKIFPSIRFEYFLTFTKNAMFVVGNSSLGIREAPYYGIPTINIGSRQDNRMIKQKKNKSIFHCDYKKETILQLTKRLSNKPIRYKPEKYFGKGNSDKIFLKILKNNTFWKTNIQKQFREISF